MKLKALIVGSTTYYRDVLGKFLSDIGVDCDIFSRGEAAIETNHATEYTFIFVCQYLDDMGGELFLHRYREKYTLGDALPIMITADIVSEVMLDANKAGFKVVFNKKDLESIPVFLTYVLNNRILSLESNILFIEDQQSIAEPIVTLFESYQANIDHVRYLSEAKEKFSKNNYDLVITDFYLKDKETGDAVINFVRDYDDSYKARTPILVISSETDQTKRIALLRNGVNDFITEPYDRDELVVRSSSLIDNKKVYEQAKKQEEELTRLAMTDQLTGLYNRHSLFDIGPKYISDAIRHKFPISLLVIDLDFFKNVNDTHGHSVGDIVLKSIGEVLNDNCRKEDFVARFGGEEFVMLLSHCDFDYATIKAESIRLAIEESKPNDLLITASIGAAALGEGDDFESLFDKADKAVYKAKKSGRNQVVLHPCKFDSMV